MDLPHAGCAHTPWTYLDKLNSLWCTSCVNTSYDLAVSVRSVSSVAEETMERIKSLTTTQEQLEQLCFGGSSLERLHKCGKVAKDAVDSYLLNVVRQVRTTQGELHQKIDAIIGERQKLLHDVRSVHARIATLLSETARTVAVSDNNIALELVRSHQILHCTSATLVTKATQLITSYVEQSSLPIVFRSKDTCLDFSRLTVSDGIANIPPASGSRSLKSFSLSRHAARVCAADNFQTPAMLSLVNPNACVLPRCNELRS